MLNEGRGHACTYDNRPKLLWQGGETTIPRQRLGSPLEAPHSVAAQAPIQTCTPRAAGADGGSPERRSPALQVTREKTGTADFGVEAALGL